MGDGTENYEPAKVWPPNGSEADRVLLYWNWGLEVPDIAQRCSSTPGAVTQVVVRWRGKGARLLDRKERNRVRKLLEAGEKECDFAERFDREAAAELQDAREAVSERNAWDVRGNMFPKMGELPEPAALVEEPRVEEPRTFYSTAPESRQRLPVTLIHERIVSLLCGCTPPANEIHAREQLAAVRALAELAKELSE